MMIVMKEEGTAGGEDLHLLMVQKDNVLLIIPHLVAPLITTWSAGIAISRVDRTVSIN